MQLLITCTYSFIVLLSANKRDLPSEVDGSTGELELSGGLGGTSKFLFKDLYLKWNSFFFTLRILRSDDQ